MKNLHYSPPGTAKPQASPSSSSAPQVNAKHQFRTIRWFVWLYFFMIIFEGVLRKWLFPLYSAPLLFVRDPILLAIYFMAGMQKIFPRNKYVFAAAIIGALTFVAGLVVLWDTPAIAFFGFRSNFMALPLIFVIARVFDIEDVKKVGYWTMVMAMPLALLMALQFRAPATSVLNAGAGEGAGQIASAGGHVRAAATFSYVLGPIYFFAMVGVFLAYSQLAKTKYPAWLIVGSTLSLALAAATSGSRSFVLTLGMIFAAVIYIGVFLRPSLTPKIARIMGGIALALALLSQTSLFNEAVDIFNARVEHASHAEGGASDVMQSRVFEDFLRPFDVVADVPLLGYGLGSGTIAGSFLASGKQGFGFGRDSERELTRNVLESGAALGFLFIGLRFWLTYSFFALAIRQARRGNSLPLLLCSVSGYMILNGQLAQTTLQAFAVFISGLVLAASNPGVAPRPMLFSRSKQKRPGQNQPAQQQPAQQQHLQLESGVKP